MKKFTLIELLVVVAIIGILASMLMPSLTKAREKAKRAVCLSNLHQNYMVVAMYADAYNSKLPNADRVTSHTVWLNNKTFELFDRKRSSLHCPNMSKITNIQPDAVVIGYGYLGSRPAIASAYNYEMAESMIDDPGMPLFADWNDSSISWHAYAHGPSGGTGTTRSGSIIPTSNASEGSNIVYLEGSARFNSKSSMQVYNAAVLNQNFKTMWNYRE